MESVDSQARDPSEPGGRRAWFWPVLICAFLGIHVLVWVTFAFIAVRDPSFSVEPHHYQKSLQWDATAEQLRVNRSLGWRVEIETEAFTGIRGDRGLSCRVLDRGGKPVEGAVASLVLFHHSRGQDRREVALEERGGGVYTARPLMKREGIWECRLTLRQGPVRFTHVELHEVRNAGIPGREAP